MANESVPVTARKIGPDRGNLTRPKVFYLTQDEIKKIERFTGGCAIFLKYARGKKVEVFESPEDVQTAFSLGATTNPYTAGNQDLAVSAAGSVLTSATVLSKYLNKVTAATATSADGVRLPAASTRNVCVIINGTSVPIDVFPHTASAFIDSGVSGAAKTIPAFGRMHFATPYIASGGNTAIWKTAKDKNVS